MTTPELLPNARITGPARQQLATQLAARYHAGASIREICAQTGYSIGRVRGLPDASSAPGVVASHPLPQGRMRRQRVGGFVAGAVGDPPEQGGVRGHHPRPPGRGALSRGRRGAAVAGAGSPAARRDKRAAGRGASGHRAAEPVTPGTNMDLAGIIGAAGVRTALLGGVVNHHLDQRVLLLITALGLRTPVAVATSLVISRPGSRPRRPWREHSG